MTPSQLADLEITLHRDKEVGYSVDLRFEHNDVTSHLLQNPITAISFDRERLRALALDTPAYGHALGEMLFAGIVHEKLVECRAKLQGLPMRVRLVIGTDASELQGLRWETLRDPEDGSDLLGARTPFSRYVCTTIDRDASWQYRERLRTLIAVANPRGITQYGICPIDTSTYLSIARQIVGPQECTELTEDQASLDNLIDKLRLGCDLLYIVAHGGISDGEPHLALAGGDGEVAFAPAQSLVHCIRNLDEVPRLAILVSCESAGAEQDTDQTEPMPLVALGPLLAEAGVPAVIAMQGCISTETATRFLEVFVETLRQTGIIDIAAAFARDSVHDRPDAWMPVLFMRSKSGLLWYRQQPTNDRPQFDKWKTLIQHLKAGTCVPIIGPGLLEPLIGSTSEIAARLAQRHDLELESPARENLPQVAQLLELRMDRTAMRREIADVLYEELARRSGGVWPDDKDTRPLHERLRQASEKIWRGGFDPYQALASFPLPLFVNAAPDSLLEFALESIGKQPHIVLCPWSNELHWANGAIPFNEPGLATIDREPVGGHCKLRMHRSFVPDELSPVVYHPFGLFQVPPSLVLTEDDYFQYLVGNTKNQNKIPPAVRYGLTASSLLFLGFQLDDWGFRVLLREILKLDRRALREELTHVAVQHVALQHVAVQIDPSTLSRTVQQRVEYLEEQFRAYHITIYWGSTSEFIRHLEDEYDHIARATLANRVVNH
ncbi:MAG: CHAT domain-containing protein [Chloroflexales bacterium]|nr:CHAT domain-containing protein [Chloroflexales bacterium]